MIVTIMRHGEAGMASSDRERALTPRGRAEVEQGARALLAACAGRSLPNPDTLLYSLWTRAAQTADIVGRVLAPDVQEEEAALRPGGDCRQVDAALTARAEADRHLLLVSHQPLVSRLADHYLGERGLAPGLNPGGMVTLDLEPAAAGCGSLLFWALPPGYEVAL